jgi:hypothetical protein
VRYRARLFLKKILTAGTDLANVPAGSPSSLFRPPEGLLPHEEVIWVRQTESGIQGRKGPIAILIFMSLFLTVGILAQNYVMIGFSVLFVFVGAWALYSAVTQHGTRFYLTSFRVIETKKENIVQQVYRSIFRGKTPSQFLWGMTRPFLAPGQEPTEVGVRIMDPSSGQTLLSLGTLPTDLVRELESMGTTSYCRYCGRRNDGQSSVCFGCGANL